MEITLLKRQTMYKISKIRVRVRVRSMVLCAVKKKKKKRQRRGLGDAMEEEGIKRRTQHVPSIEGCFPEVTCYT